jgi:hypothetical protein
MNVEKQEIENATFLENINAVLEERDLKVKESRLGLLRKYSYLHNNLENSTDTSIKKNS